MTVTLNPGSGGSNMATDQVDGAEYQHVKLTTGADGTATKVSPADPVPVVTASEQILANSLVSAVKHATFALSVDGAIVSAVASKKIRVLSMIASMEMGDNNETYEIKDGSDGGTSLSGLMSSPAAAAFYPTTQFKLEYNPFGHFETTAGNALYMDVEGTSPAFTGSVTYVEV